MTYDVLVRYNPEGRYRATVLGWPDCTVEGPSRHEVIQRARQAVVNLLARAELIRIEVKPPRTRSALAQFAGIWAEDDTFDEFVAAMESYRHDVDTDEYQP